MVLKCEMECLFNENKKCTRMQVTFGVLNGSGMIGCKNFVPLTCIYCILYTNKECKGKNRICNKFNMLKGNDWIGFENETEVNRTGNVNT